MNRAMLADNWDSIPIHPLSPPSPACNRQHKRFRAFQIYYEKQECFMRQLPWHASISLGNPLLLSLGPAFLIATSQATVITLIYMSICIIFWVGSVSIYSVVYPICRATRDKEAEDWQEKLLEELKDTYTPPRDRKERWHNLKLGFAHAIGCFSGVLFTFPLFFNLAGALNVYSITKATINFSETSINSPETSISIFYCIYAMIVMAITFSCAILLCTCGDRQIPINAMGK